MGALAISENLEGRNFTQAVKYIHGSLVPDYVWFHSDLKPLDIKVFKVLMMYAEETAEKYKRKYLKDQFYPGVLKSQKTVADMAGCSDRSIRTAYKRLSDAGLIEVEERSANDTNIVYMLGEKLGILSEHHGLTESERQEVSDIKDLRMRKECGYTGDLETFRRWRDLGGISRNEKEVVALADHYAMLARRRTNMPGYKALSMKRPSEHKNFKKFEELKDLAEDRQWDAKQYLEFIFMWSETYWGKDPVSGKRRFPFPKQIMSEKLIANYEKELIRQDKRYRLSEFGRKIAEPKTRSYTEEIENNITMSVDSVSYYLKQYQTRKKYKQIQKPLPDEQYKAAYISNNWYQLSAEYLYSIPWFRDHFIHELMGGYPDGPTGKHLKEIKEKFDLFRGSKNLNAAALKCAIVQENKNRIPRNLSPSEIAALGE